MNRRTCLIANLCLLFWFFLDMTGISIYKHILVTRSYKEDGIFFLIFLVLFMLYAFKERVWKYFLTGWLFIWFTAQFVSHWYFTIFGPSIGKMNYFANTIKLIPSSNIYIPDLYHIVLHVLILVSLISMLKYCITTRKSRINRLKDNGI